MSRAYFGWSGGSELNTSASAAANQPLPRPQK